MKIENPRVRFSLMSLLVGVMVIAFVFAAYQRGSYLLGRSVGITYAAVALMIIALFARAIRETPVRKHRIAFLTLFLIPVCAAFAFPSQLNPEIQVDVDKQARARLAHNELYAVFADDPAFSDLSISTTHYKTVNVEVHGMVTSKADLGRVQQLVYERCEFVESCLVRWQVSVHDDSTMYIAQNEDAFAPESN